MTSFSEVFEKPMYNRQLGRLNDNNILVEFQFGFMKNLTTERAICELVNEILSVLIDCCGRDFL
jgi:hypothetical protein